jgi:fructose-1,6-bisphosphatase/inositol monophosphatase family enzyme
MARAQQGSRMRRIGVLLSIVDDAEGQVRVVVFQKSLADLGWTAGNLQIDIAGATATPNACASTRPNWSGSIVMRCSLWHRDFVADKHRRLNGAPRIPRTSHGAPT